MKLLFLSTGGKSNEPEDSAYLDLFLASFARHVAGPYPNSKMLLLNTFDVAEGKTSLIQQRANALGLESIVDVRVLKEMELPENAYNFMRGQSWYSNIGLNMNMLFDYSKARNFFDADWIFHTDTDIEFLPNFQDFLTPIHGMRTLAPRIVITLAGDAYPYNIYYKNNEYIFQDAERFYVYREDFPTSLTASDYQTKRVKLNPTRQHPREQEHILIFNIEQQKVRNDFVGISREAANDIEFNWVAIGYHEYLLPKNNSTDAEIELSELWKQHQENSPLKLRLNMSQDKGASVQYLLQSDTEKCLKLQLRGYTDMAKHFSSGYVDYFIYNGENFRQYSRRRLHEDYMDCSTVWSQDYP